MLTTIFAFPIAAPAHANTNVSQPILAALDRLIRVEKVADDAYALFYQATKEQRFKTVLDQENAHEGKLALVLAVNGITNPIAQLKPGQFPDPGLRTLYQQLTAQGSTSKKAALASAVKLEKNDVSDINAILAMKPPTFVANILKELRAASLQHAKIFSN